MDRAEELLSKQRYVAGSRFTEADLRLFVTLIRFDEVSFLVMSSFNRLCSRQILLLRLQHLLATVTEDPAVSLSSAIAPVPCAAASDMADC